MFQIVRLFCSGHSPAHGWFCYVRACESWSLWARWWNYSSGGRHGYHSGLRGNLYPISSYEIPRHRSVWLKPFHRCRAYGYRRDCTSHCLGLSNILGLYFCLIEYNIVTFLSKKGFLTKQRSVFRELKCYFDHYWSCLSLTYKNSRSNCWWPYPENW